MSGILENSKRLEDPVKIAVFIPCYKRPEYTAMCLEAIKQAQEYSPHTVFYVVDDGSNDETENVLREFDKLPIQKYIWLDADHLGLRQRIIMFFDYVRGGAGKVFDLMVKVDNDCLVPKNWLNDLVDKFQNTDADILSPNVKPSDAAYKNGRPDPSNLGYRPSSHVGGVWAMRSHLINEVDFERIRISGVRGAFQVLNQIIIEKEPKIGWLENVTYQDVGHWSGEHPEHIKSREHELYSCEIGRRIAWASQS